MKLKLSCAYCNDTFFKYPSQIKGKKRVFCKPACYHKYVSEVLPSEEQNAWKGGIDPRESSRQWKKRNKDKMKAMAKARREREMMAEGSHTKGEWEVVKSKYNYECAEKDDTCHGYIAKDHIVPITMGGSNWPDNLQPLCQSHNSRKARKVYLGRYQVD